MMRTGGPGGRPEPGWTPQPSQSYYHDPHHQDPHRPNYSESHPLRGAEYGATYGAPQPGPPPPVPPPVSTMLRILKMQVHTMLSRLMFAIGCYFIWQGSVSISATLSLVEENVLFSDLPASLKATFAMSFLLVVVGLFLVLQEWIAPEMNQTALMTSIRREEAMLVRYCGYPRT
jgi:hypothetical protein